ncbi:three-helix bundle dimerization domain-containing protein [Rhodococcus sp. NPDC059968]|uniref:three-helix bundle dimerization domain-containing protein n=1 Tax=Rhodococcus sp. NPDC059968 TaxID=3347017 RepID=UPI00366CD527
MDVTERQHVDAVRTLLVRRYQFVDPHLVAEMVDTAHHRFDGCRIRDFVPLLVERAAIRSLDAALAAGAATPATVPATVPAEHHHLL